MKVGLTVSVVGHVALVVAASSVGVYNAPAAPDMNVLEIDVDIISEQEFVTQTTPIPEVFEMASAENVPEVPWARPVDAKVADLNPELEFPAPIMTPSIQDASLSKPTGIKLPEVNVDAPSISPQNSAVDQALSLPVAKEFKMPEINRVTTEFNPEPRPDVRIADHNQMAIKEVMAPKPDVVKMLAPKPTAKAASIPVISTEANKADEVAAPSSQSSTLEKMVMYGAPLTRPANLRAPNLNGDNEIAQMIAEVNELTTISTKAFVRKALTSQEKSRLVSKIQNAWNLGSMSSEAMRVTISVEFRMDQNGKPFDIALKSYSGGSQAAADTAFEAGRRAITKGLENGHDLPLEKYDQWKVVQITFDPENMRAR